MAASNTPIDSARALIQDVEASTGLINGDTSENAQMVGHAAQEILGVYGNALTTASAYIELLIIGATVSAAVFVAFLIHFYINHRFKSLVTSESWGWLLKPVKLMAPLLVLVSLSIAKPLVAKTISEPLFFFPATQIAFAWLLVHTVHILVRSKMMAWFLSIVLATLVGLQTFGLSQPIALLLGNIGFQIAGTHITLLSVLHGAILCVILFWAAVAGSNRLEKQLRSSKLSYNVRELLIKFIKIVIYFGAFLLTLSAMGVDLTAFAVFGGALGVGIGLGLQKITANFVSGITLLVEKSVRQGDLIQVNGVHGYVREMNIRYMLVETFSGQEVSIPNETLTSNNIINWTMSNAKARIEVTVGVAYGSNYKRVQELMLQAANEHSRTLKDPLPVCVMREFADSSVKFLLQFWVANVVDGLYAPQSDVMFRIADLFEENHITIPFPQREIHIKAPTNPIGNI